MIKLILQLILFFFLPDDSDARNLGLKHNDHRSQENEVNRTPPWEKQVESQCYRALGFQRNLLSTRGTLRGNKEEEEKKSEQPERGT